MDGVKRYRMLASGRYSVDPNGMWVLGSDFDAALAREAALREELAKVIEDRARFPDRPDFVGNMISAHIGNLKALAASAEKYSRMWADRMTAAEQRNAELQKDKDRLDALESNFWDVRHNSHPIADTGDSSSSLEIVGHWMDRPFERVIGEDYNENLRAAIDQAMAAPAYPPERPEYPEIDELLSQPTESGASDKCASDGGTCGLGGHCGECPHIESGASE